jgi:hypothetical protein
MLAERKRKFYQYYKSNPDKLKGKTIDEAYAGMRREVERRKNMDNKNGSIQRVLKGGDRTQAIQRRLNHERNTPILTPGNSERHYPVNFPKNPKVLSEYQKPKPTAASLQAQLNASRKSTAPKKARNFGL